MKQSNIFKPTLIFSQKTSVSIFVHFVYDMLSFFFILHDLSPYEKCQNFVLIRQLIRDLQTNGFNATSF